MFGNVKGWIMSAVIVALTGALIWYASQSPKRSPPTGKLAVALKPSAVPDLDFDSIVPKGTKDRDAAEVLQELAAKVKDKRMEFDKFRAATALRDRRAEFPRIEREMKLLLEAADCNRLGGLAKAEELVVYGDKPYLAAIRRAAQAAGLYAQAVAFADNRDAKFKPDPAKARRYAEASFRVGRLLYDDRVIFKQWRDGLDIMRQAAFDLAYVDGGKDPGLKDRCTAFQEKVKAAADPAVQTWADISHPVQANYPGDVFRVALEAPDPMWRAEAILKLGRMRFMKGVSQADQRDAKLVVEQIAAQPNLPPAVRVAADRARKLDEQGFQDYDRE